MFITEFRELNKIIQSKLFPMTNIQYYLDEIRGFQLFTVIYLITRLYDYMQRLFIILLPWKIYQYQGLPVVFYIYMDLFQEKISASKIV